MSGPGKPEKLQQSQSQNDIIRFCHNQCMGINPLFSMREQSPPLKMDATQERETALTTGAATTVQRASAQVCSLHPLSRSQSP